MQNVVFVRLLKTTEAGYTVGGVLFQNLHFGAMLADYEIGPQYAKKKKKKKKKKIIYIYIYSLDLIIKA